MTFKDQGNGGGTSIVPRRVNWDLSDSVLTSIATAGRDFDSLQASVDLDILDSDAFDLEFQTKFRRDKDALLQMSFQLGHFFTHQCSAAAYESASTAAFKHGRTETIRPTTIESDAFCR